MSDEDHPEDLRHLPLDGWHRARGGRMVPFAGYEMPVQYTGIIPEHEWTRGHASLFDVSHMGQVYIHGAGDIGGTEAALEALLPADLGSLALGAMRYSLLLTDDGGIIDDLIASRWKSGFYLVVNGATKDGDIAHIRAHLPEGVELDRLDDAALLALQGPEAFVALERHVSGENPLSALRFMRAGQFEIAGAPVWISRAGYTGEDGFEISLPASHAETIADLLCGEPEVRPAGLGARDSLRLEAGLPLYGHDLSTETDPVSAGLSFAISKRRRVEGGFPGAGRILGLLANGPERKLVGLSLDGRMAAREHAPVVVGEQQVGEVTSGGFSPTLGHAIALAYVDAAHAAPGTALEAVVRSQRLPAQVVPLPFVPHRYHR